MATLTDRLPGVIPEDRVASLAAYAGLVVAVLMVPLRFVASNVYLESIPIVLGGACLLFLYTSRSRSELSELPRFPYWTSRLLASLSIVGIGVLGLIAAYAGGRTLTFLLLGGAVASILLVQILFTRREDLHVGLILLQVLALALVIRFAALLTTPGFVGVDIWTHVTDYSRLIQQAGSLEPISDIKYYTAPLYHLLVVASAELLGTSLRTALFVSLGLIMVLSTLFIYGTARFFVPVRWALVAVAIFAISDWVVRWGIHLIPNSLGLVFFLAILYGLVRLFHADDDRRTYALLVVAIVGVVLTHQVSAFIVLVLLGTAVAVQLVMTVFDRWLDGPGASVNLVGLFAFDLAFSFGMWAITPLGGRTFLQRVIDWLVDSTRTSFGFLNLPSSGGAAAGSGPAAATSFVPYLDALGLLILLFVAVVGSLASLHRRRITQSRLTLIAAIVMLLAFVFVLPLFGIRALLPSRWVAFAYAPMVVVGAIGLFHLSHTGRSRTAIAVLLLFVLLTPTAMMVSGNGTMDSPVFETENVRYSYSSAELEAVRDIGQLRPEQTGPLYTDHPYVTVFNRTGAHNGRPIHLADSGRPVEHDAVVYRSYQSNGAAQFLAPTNDLVTRQLSRSNVCRPEMNAVYSNGAATMCTDAN